MMTIKEQDDLRYEVLDRLITDEVLEWKADFAVRHAAVFRPLFRASRLLPAPVVIGTAADALAIDLGYTRRVEIEGGCMGGEFLIRADEDLDGRFKAWGVDWQEWTWVHGCNVLIAEIDDTNYADEERVARDPYA